MLSSPTSSDNTPLHLKSNKALQSLPSGYTPIVRVDVRYTDELCMRLGFAHARDEQRALMTKMMLAVPASSTSLRSQILLFADD